MTQPGLQTDVQLITRALGNKLSIESAQGKLLSDFALQNIHYQDDSKTIQIKSFIFSWNPLGLLKRKLLVNSIAVENANIIVNKISNASSSPSNSSRDYLSYLKNIRVKKIKFKQISAKFMDATVTINGSLEKNWDLAWKADIPNAGIFLAGSKGALSTSGSVMGSFLTPNIKANFRGKNLVYANQQISELNAAVNFIVPRIATPSTDVDDGRKGQLSSSLNISASGVKINDYPLKKFDLSVKGDIALTNQALSARLATIINKKYPIFADISLPQFAGIHEMNQPVSAKIYSSLSHLDLLASYIPQIKNPQGTLQATIFVKGTLAQPQVTVNLNVLNGRLNVPSLGISPSRITLQGTTTLKNQLNFSGNFISGNGRADLQGTFDFNNPDYPLTLHVKGSQLQAINLTDYNFIISPDVDLTYAKNNLKLQGTVLIPNAKMTPENFSSTITMPNDVVFVGSKETAQLPFTTSLQLNLKLGEHIHLAYQSLETKLAGEVLITQLPGTLINAVGELYTEKGVYKAYGQTLNIQTGRLIYTGGSLTNPGLSISAIKKLKSVSTGGNVSNFSGQTSLNPIYTGTQTITVGVEVIGTLDHPQFNLISTPVMAQADILSYLVFGFPQSQASGNQYGAILSALSSLNPNTPSVGDFTKNIQDKLGLSQVGVESVQVFNPNATSNANSVVSATSFVVGKKLSNHLSIHYSIGLFYPVSILNLRYELSKHWAVQSETSTLDSGGDVLYTIERD